MPPTPEVKPLPHLQRKIVFICSVLVFAVTVPLLVFYTTGYRFDFSGEVSNIKAVGGIYITSDVRNIEMYIDDEPVKDMRIFQNAAYIQNLETVVHQVHTQKEGLQTWVKNVPVFPYLVTEAQSFNLPMTPQVRLVTQYATPEGDSVVKDTSTTTFSFASTTNTFFVATSTASTTFDQNPEFIYVQTLFASSTEEKKLLAQQRELIERNRFTFGPIATSSEEIMQATTTKKWRDIQLTKIGTEVYAQWAGKDQDIPYYFCIKYENASSTIAQYGEHVYDALVSAYGTSTNTFSNALYVSDRLCRTQIRIDRLWQSVQWFDFLPDNRDYVLMQLQDGLYVVEIDDRSWQNTQLLYPGDYLEVVLDGGRIFIKDDEFYLEVFTDLQG